MEVEFIPQNEYNVELEVVMDYLTSIETAEKWGISRRRVTVLCNEGRVKGAVLKGNTWLIPDKAEKPKEMKRGVKPKKNN